MTMPGSLEVMLRHGRKPMSMTHGDFDETYLRHLALDAEGRPRFDVLRMAGHFDALMLGRRGVSRPRAERDLDAPRRTFVEMFERLQAEHGVQARLQRGNTPWVPSHPTLWRPSSCASVRTPAGRSAQRRSSAACVSG